MTQGDFNKWLSSHNGEYYFVDGDGVSFNKKSYKWEAYIGIDNKRINLGKFNDFEDAVSARKEAEEKYFGEWSYNNSQTGSMVICQIT